MTTLLLLLADAGAMPANFDLNALWQQMAANSPYAAGLAYVLWRTMNRSDKREDRILTAFEENGRASSKLADAVNGLACAAGGTNSGVHRVSELRRDAG